MSQSPFVVDATVDNFQQLVIDRSHQMPVLVDFWAEWCAPCKALMPILEKLVGEFQGAFTLAKVDTEEQAALVQHYGIKSLPTVKLFVNGEAVDEFMGALPETEIRAFISKHLKSPLDQAMEIALAAETAEDFPRAQEVYQEVINFQADHTPALLGLATLCLTGKLGFEDEQARAMAATLLDQVPSDDHKLAEYIQLRAELNFEPADEGQLNELIAAHEQAPDDYALVMQLANTYIAHRNYEAGLQLMLQTVQKAPAYNDGEGKSSMLDAFNLIGLNEPIVRSFRRKLASALN